ncbi:hypothetical protein [Cysteiniphilum halobium]|uniref:hypothetical protein n=1 Tax=Cysteiniphilum halobium TaxID=2219059 RepID=UPI000E659D45|nr:hypothetical protein [Cysteiniphilum halobium]
MSKYNNIIKKLMSLCVLSSICGGAYAASGIDINLQNSGDMPVSLYYLQQGNCQNNKPGPCAMDGSISQWHQKSFFLYPVSLKTASGASVGELSPQASDSRVGIIARTAGRENTIFVGTSLSGANIDDFSFGAGDGSLYGTDDEGVNTNTLTVHHEADSVTGTSIIGRIIASDVNKTSINPLIYRLFPALNDGNSTNDTIYRFTINSKQMNYWSEKHTHDDVFSYLKGQTHFSSAFDGYFVYVKLDNGDIKFLGRVMPSESFVMGDMDNARDAQNAFETDFQTTPTSFDLAIPNVGSSNTQPLISEVLVYTAVGKMPTVGDLITSEGAIFKAIADYSFEAIADYPLKIQSKEIASVNISDINNKLPNTDFSDFTLSMDPYNPKSNSLIQLDNNGQQQEPYTVNIDLKTNRDYHYKDSKGTNYSIECTSPNPSADIPLAIGDKLQKYLNDPQGYYNCTLTNLATHQKVTTTPDQFDPDNISLYDDIYFTDSNNNLWTNIQTLNPTLSVDDSGFTRIVNPYNEDTQSLINPGNTSNSLIKNDNGKLIDVDYRNLYSFDSQAEEGTSLSTEANITVSATSSIATTSANHIAVAQEVNSVSRYYDDVKASVIKFLDIDYTQGLIGNYWFAMSGRCSTSQGCDWVPAMTYYTNNEGSNTGYRVLMVTTGPFAVHYYTNNRNSTMTNFIPKYLWQSSQEGDKCLPSENQYCTGNFILNSDPNRYPLNDKMMFIVGDVHGNVYTNLSNE